MNVPLEISFRETDQSDQVEQLIRDRAEKLERVCPHLSSCRVAVEKTQKHQSKGQRFRVRIDMNVPPNHRLAVSREPSKGDLHTDLVTEIRDAFDAAERQVRSLNEKQQGEVKSHPDQEVQAVVEMLDKEQGYGFLRNTDGQQIYFHRNSVLRGEFDDLAIGTGVQYTPELGEKGLQASTVQKVAYPPHM